MKFGHLLSVLRARWLSAALVWLTVVVGVTAFSLARTPLFTATASVVLDVKSPDPIAGVVLPGMNASSYMATQVGVLQSDRVVARAIKALGLDQDPDLKTAWLNATAGRGDQLAWLADKVGRNLDAVPAREANLINLSFSDKNPERAAQMANAVVKAYIDTTLELRVEPARQYASFFDARAKNLREDLEAAQTRLSAYQRNKGLLIGDGRMDVESARLSELSSQLVVLQGLANESGSRAAQSTGNADRMQEVLSNPLIVSLATELSRSESKLNELVTRLGDSHPQVIEQRNSIAQARERLDAETRRVASSLTVNNNVNVTRLNQLRAAVDEQRNKLLQLKSARDEVAVLQRDVENAQRAYDQMLGRATQTGVESQTTQTNVSVLKQATTPADPSSPRLVLNIAVAVLVGLLLAVATVITRETADRRLRTTEDISNNLGLQFLGRLPDVRPARALSTRARLRLTGPAKRRLGIRWPWTQRGVSA